MVLALASEAPSIAVINTLAKTNLEEEWMCVQVTGHHSEKSAGTTEE